MGRHTHFLPIGLASRPADWSHPEARNRIQGTDFSNHLYRVYLPHSDQNRPSYPQHSTLAETPDLESWLALI